jgi:hypothetical protein
MRHAGAGGLNPPVMGPTSPFRRGLSQHGVHPRAHRHEQNSGISCSGRLPRCLRVDRVPQSAGGMGGANRQAAPGRPHAGGGRILPTCTFSRLRGRAAGPCLPPWRAVDVLRLGSGLVII